MARKEEEEEEAALHQSCINLRVTVLVLVSGAATSGHRYPRTVVYAPDNVQAPSQSPPQRSYVVASPKGADGGGGRCQENLRHHHEYHVAQDRRRRNSRCHTQLSPPPKKSPMETHLVALDFAELVELPDVVSGSNEPAENFHFHDSFANICT